MFNFVYNHYKKLMNQNVKKVIIPILIPVDYNNTNQWISYQKQKKWSYLQRYIYMSEV